MVKPEDSISLLSYMHQSTQPKSSCIEQKHVTFFYLIASKQIFEAKTLSYTTILSYINQLVLCLKLIRKGRQFTYMSNTDHYTTAPAPTRK